MPRQARRTRWAQVAGIQAEAAVYQHRFDALAASGADVHGEARLVSSLVPPGSRVLDAGCGTGRVAKELTRLGYHCIGVDEDAGMVEYAQRLDPATTYLHQDLAELSLSGAPLDLVLMAGNVVPLLAPGTLTAVLQHVVGRLHTGGLLVAGFGLDAGHLPRGCPVTPLSDYDTEASAAGLVAVSRHSTWQTDPWEPDAGYVVDVRRAA